MASLGFLAHFKTWHYAQKASRPSLTKFGGGCVRKSVRKTLAELVRICTTYEPRQIGCQEIADVGAEKAGYLAPVVPLD